MDDKKYEEFDHNENNLVGQNEFITQTSIDEETIQSQELEDSVIISASSSDSRRQEKQKVKLDNCRGYIRTVSAGIIGSMLTLALLPFADFYHEYYSSVQNENQRDGTVSQVREAEVTDSNVTATPTIANPTGSIADIVEKASPAIVGIVNLQQQRNRFTSSTDKVESGTGSGVIFKTENNVAYIVTNNMSLKEQMR
ncbi:S1C family serine protease [Litchfieldia alkalitelluris]|uniref:S1C family serine protease n=1 Tax=Litchfieldia alkalitelluris TaxID=304268 RepID=UPI001F312556|nr:S1C family serine protease [Litchfieldia alkalitelluris]